MDTVSTVHPDSAHTTKRKVAWDEIERYVGAIVAQIRESGIEVKQIFGVPRGGSLLAVLFSHELNIPIVHDDSIVDKTTLIVDDVIESGNTVSELLSSSKAYAAILYVSERASPELRAHPRLLTGTTKAANEWVVLPWEKA